jgi:hypothetical protein
MTNKQAFERLTKEMQIADLQIENARLRDLLELFTHDIPAVDCMMCDKDSKPRKAVTSIADIPACEQCAKEYQDAEDALANGAPQ